MVSGKSYLSEDSIKDTLQIYATEFLKAKFETFIGATKYFLRKIVHIFQG